MTFPHGELMVRVAGVVERESGYDTRFVGHLICR